MTNSFHGRSRYRGGVRGFSYSPRAGGYGPIGMTQLVGVADRDTTVVGQIEDRVAVAAISANAAIDEVDCLNLGATLFVLGSDQRA